MNNSCIGCTVDIHCLITDSFVRPRSLISLSRRLDRRIPSSDSRKTLKSITSHSSLLNNVKRPSTIMNLAEKIVLAPFFLTCRTKS